MIRVLSIPLAMHLVRCAPADMVVSVPKTTAQLPGCVCSCLNDHIYAQINDPNNRHLERPRDVHVRIHHRQGVTGDENDVGLIPLNHAAQRIGKDAGLALRVVPIVVTHIRLGQRVTEDDLDRLERLAGEGFSFQVAANREAAQARIGDQNLEVLPGLEAFERRRCRRRAARPSRRSSGPRAGKGSSGFVPILSCHLQSRMYAIPVRIWQCNSRGNRGGAASLACALAVSDALPGGCGGTSGAGKRTRPKRQPLNQRGFGAVGLSDLLKAAVACRLPRS